MRELPAGTVTFLFTDIEGSTRLLQELGAAYADALAEHRTVLRESFTRHNGVEVDTQGDACFVAFARANDALAAAAEAQQALESGRIRVRIGVHTGEPVLTDEGYVGMDVHRGARIAAAGHGGQVVVSQTTRDLGPLDGLRSLGEHRLKDLTAPERLYQLGDHEFPPLKTLYRTNLPVPATGFLGRQRELSQISEVLARRDVRLLTLTGAGGTGKTRLAMQAAAASADRYPDGVFWVPLAPLRDPTLVFEVVGRALGAQGRVADHVTDQRLLLLLDNFEHVMPAAAELADLLASCPNIDVLVTSREVLQLRGEHAYPVPPLDVEEGVELFLARARAHSPAFATDDAVRDLCRRLDYLPLAIELAAARTRHLSARQLLDRLSRRLDVLKGGRDANPRQHTLRATIEWSYDLLSTEEQGLFARLAVFSGGWTLEAVEKICDADLDTLGSLVDKSLVRRNDERYWLLETIREYAEEKLGKTGQAQDLHRRHADHFLSLADAAGLHVEAVQAGLASQLDLAAADLDNLRAAIDWGMDCDPLLAMRLTIALEQLWVSNHPFEGARRIEAVLLRCHDAPLELRARAHRVLGGTLQIGGLAEKALPEYQLSRQLYRQLGDERGVSHLTHRLAVTEFALDHVQQARELIEETLTLARSVGSRLDEASALGALALIEDQAGNYGAALELTQRSMEVSRPLEFDWFHAIEQMNLAELMLKLGKAEDAEVHAREALRLSRRTGRQNTIYSLATLALVAKAKGNLSTAGRLWGAVLAEERSAPVGAWEAFEKAHFAAQLELPDAEFTDGVAAGHRLSLDEVVDETLKAPERSWSL